MLCSNVGQTWYISLKVLEASRSGASRASLWCCSAWDETWSIHQLNIFIWNWNKISSKAPPAVHWLNWPGTCAHPAAPLEAIWGQWPEKVGSRQRKVSMFQTIHCVQSWFQTCLAKFFWRACHDHHLVMRCDISRGSACAASRSQPRVVLQRIWQRKWQLEKHSLIKL